MPTHKKSFKESYTEAQRLKEANRILSKHPGRVPIIFEKMKGNDAPELENHKYLVPSSISVGQFMHTMRKKMYPVTEKNGHKIDSSSQAIFIFVNNNLPKMSSLMSEIYEQNKSEDNFTYITYSTETTFG